MYVAPRFCRHLCEVNCLSDSPDKIDCDAKGVKRGNSGDVAHYSLSFSPFLALPETHELGKSSFDSSLSSFSLSLSLSLSLYLYLSPFFPLIVREGRREKRSPRPFITIRNDDTEALFVDCCGQTMLEINRSNPSRGRLGWQKPSGGEHFTIKKRHKARAQNVSKPTLQNL